LVASSRRRFQREHGNSWCRFFKRYLLLPLFTTAAQSAGQIEAPPTLPAQTLAPPGLLAGQQGFRVDSPVPTDRLTALFTIRSGVGTFPAPGLQMLRIRVAELPAITQLEQTSKTGVFAQSLATNAVRPVKAAGQMVMNPIETVQGLPGGVQRFFGRVGHGAQQIAQAATDSDQSGVERAGGAGSRAGKATKDILGYEKERRELAEKLDVDPYTSNPVLAPLLDEIATVAFRAHVGVNVAMSMAVPGSITITCTTMVSNWVWDIPRAGLIVRSKNKLKDLGVPDASVNAFTNNIAFPLSVQTSFVENLSRLSGVPGCANAAGWRAQ
jgi:hypothetical protein